MSETLTKLRLRKIYAEAHIERKDDAIVIMFGEYDICNDRMHNTGVLELTEDGACQLRDDLDKAIWRLRGQ